MVILAACAGLGTSPASAAGSEAEGFADCGSAPLTRRCHDPRFDHFLSGEPGLRRPQPRQPGLFLMGGGGVVAGAYGDLARRAGLGRLVVIRATTDAAPDVADGDLGARFVGEWHATSARTFTFRDRRAAFDRRVLAALARADGIFIAGGDQANYIRYLKGTPVASQIDARVRAGCPLGGSSAGLAVMGHYSYTALDGGSLESRVALAAPRGPGVTLESEFLRLPGLERVITDSHFGARARLGRLIAFVARLREAYPAARPFGVGVDERTVLRVEADGTAGLVEGSAGSAWVVSLERDPVLPRASGPVGLADVRVERMGPGSRLRVASGEVAAPLSLSRVRVTDGQPTGDAVTAAILSRDPPTSEEP